MERVTSRVLGSIALVFSVALLINGAVRVTTGNDTVWGVLNLAFALVGLCGCALLFRSGRGT
jgi:hypothetical protein